MAEDKLVAAVDAWRQFVGQFPDDIYTKIVLEEIFGAIYGNTVPLSGEAGQKGGENPHGISGEPKLPGNEGD
jgi:hypothetical protein